jgi:hypothetical protein
MMGKVSCDCSRQSQEVMRRTYQVTRQDRKSKGRGCITSLDESLSDDVFQLICGECDGGSRMCRSNSIKDFSFSHLETKYAKTDSKNGIMTKN